MKKNFNPLVVGAPRSGFSLLASVVIHFMPLVDRDLGLRQRILNKLTNGVGDYIANNIMAEFADYGHTDDVLYNPNFRYIVGGPKWIDRDTPDSACFRKYIGVKGKGDFTLITRHPRELLNLDEIVHSHVDPELWLEHPAYIDYTKFASIRNPVDILNSSVFSLNALSSEYIQKFVPPEDDNDIIRQNLALYKFTDMDFFEGVTKFLFAYFQEFIEVYDRYIVMRWEDLITNPHATIKSLAESSGIEISDDYVQSIWQKLDHVNLTQAHKHNFRRGHGIVGDWKNWVTNHHLQLIKDYGFEPYMQELGFGKIEFFDESKYTPFQQRVNQYINNKQVYNDFPDKELFTFAFNKSNFASDKFPFDRYAWREHTQIERSIFQDQDLLMRISDRAEKATMHVNGFLNDYLSDSQNIKPVKLLKLLQGLERKYQSTLGDFIGSQYTSAFEDAKNLLDVQNTRPFGRIKSALAKII